MDYAIARRRMVDQQIVARGIHAPLVIEAMKRVPRHRFVEEALWSQAYGDHPLPIGEKQTISQPYMVALMTQALELKGGRRFSKSVPAPGIRLLSWLRSFPESIA